MKTFGTALLAALLLAAPARAQVVDLSTITCKDFLASGKDNIGSIMMWLDGYYTDDDGPAVVNFDKMKEKGAKLGEYCAKNPTIGLITAAEQFLGK
jgi:acid stress chaperone HdeB